MIAPIVTAPTVTACIPYYGGRRYITRAVEGLLAQTHRDLDIIVVNDGDPDRPWAQLRHLRDPRLILFDLKRNHGGPFFANAVVAEAAGSPWFLVQEQDDWSAPGRVERLLHLAGERHADVAVSGQYFHRQQADGSSRPVGPRWQHSGRETCPACAPLGRCQECFVDLAVTERYWYRAPHAGLFRVELLRRIGGYYAGLHLHHDSLLMNVLLMTGTVAHTPDPLYHRLLRPDSITHAPHSGLGSEASNRERRKVIDLYGSFFEQYRRYVQGVIGSDALAESIRLRCEGNVSTEERRELRDEAARLREHLAGRRKRRLN